MTDNIRPYYKYLINTGGNDPEELVQRLDDNNLLKVNLPVGLMALSVESQIRLLQRLSDEGLLKDIPSRSQG